MNKQIIGLLMLVSVFALPGTALQIWAQDGTAKSVRFYAELTKDDTFPMPDTTVYNVNLPVTLEYPDNPKLNFVLDGENVKHLSIWVGGGTMTLNGEFQIVQENSTSRSTTLAPVNAYFGYDSETFDKTKKATVYDLNPEFSWFYIDKNRWDNTEIKSSNLTTYDDGSGIISINAEK